jgi:hypothetical protein
MASRWASLTFLGDIAERDHRPDILAAAFSASISSTRALIFALSLIEHRLHVADLRAQCCFIWRIAALWSAGNVSWVKQP